MRRTVLAIAGVDSSGGAGLTRDVQVLTAFDVEVRCVVTAVTAQTNARVAAVRPLPPDFIHEQLRTAFEDGRVDAIKIGMLGRRAAVEVVAAVLSGRNETPIVLDPVLAASSGRALLDPSGIASLRDLLLPLVTLVTPNLPEAARLLGAEPATDEATAIAQARRILAMGPQAVLMKGGHAPGDDAVDILVSGDDQPVRMRAPRLPASLRGTGCAMSSAIAASLAHRRRLDDACRRAKSFVLGKLQEAVACDPADDHGAGHRHSGGR